jgi:DNA polymerase III epsilon subunit-like protein
MTKLPANILVLDTETSGLPKDFKAPYTNTDNWPHIVQLAWQCFTPDGKLIESACDIIQPDGWTIDAEASKTHGIELEYAQLVGIPIAQALSALIMRSRDCKLIVCHNVGFDKSVVFCEIERLSRKLLFQPIRTPFYCTMLETADLVCIEHPHEYFRSKGQYKWPSLDELHMFLFGEPIAGREVHDALVDVKACARCYFELQRKIRDQPPIRHE